MLKGLHRLVSADCVLKGSAIALCIKVNSPRTDRCRKNDKTQLMFLLLSVGIHQCNVNCPLKNLGALVMILCLPPSVPRVGVSKPPHYPSEFNSTPNQKHLNKLIKVLRITLCLNMPNSLVCSKQQYIKRIVWQNSYNSYNRKRKVCGCSTTYSEVHTCVTPCVTMYLERRCKLLVKLYPTGI